MVSLQFLGQQLLRAGCHDGVLGLDAFDNENTLLHRRTGFDRLSLERFVRVLDIDEQTGFELEHGASRQKETGGLWAVSSDPRCQQRSRGRWLIPEKHEEGLVDLRRLQNELGKIDKCGSRHDGWRKLTCCNRTEVLLQQVYNFLEMPLMQTELKVRKIGNSLGILLPKDAALELQAKEGTSLFLSKAPEGRFYLSQFDAEFAKQMEVAREGMRKYRNTLKELAK